MVIRKMDNLVAGVLIGGQSRRMGTCKALLRFRGRTLVERAVCAAAEVAGEVALLGDCDLGIPAMSGMTQIADAVEAVGPMGGLCSLLEYASARWSLLLACDMPLVDAELLEHLRDFRDDRFDAVAFRRFDGADEVHACCAIYHPRVLPIVRDALSRGDAKLQNLLMSLRCNRLVPDKCETQKLTNVNTQDEFRRLMMPQSKTPDSPDSYFVTRTLRR